MTKAKVTANPGESLIHIERIFDAPREKVFKAMTDPEKVKIWWSAHGEVTIEQLDARVGGGWKFVQGTGDTSMSFFGVYHEISPERVVQTFEFSGMPERGHVVMEKMELSDAEDGKTKLNITQAFFSVADRDGLIANGMEEGMQSTYAALDKVLADM